MYNNVKKTLLITKKTQLLWTTAHHQRKKAATLTPISKCIAKKEETVENRHSVFKKIMKRENARKKAL